VLRSRDEILPLYQTMLILGAVGLAIFAAGLLLLLRLAPPGRSSGLHAPIQGVFAYNPVRHQLARSPAKLFSPDQDFAARVDWAALPSRVDVGARWYDSLQEPVGGVGPESAGQLAAVGAPVIEQAPHGFGRNPPGTYTLLVMRYADRQPVEVLGRAVVLVQGP
jgi:hypothetical protein